jgi:hypothetical protein
MRDHADEPAQRDVRERERFLTVGPVLEPLPIRPVVGRFLAIGVDER